MPVTSRDPATNRREPPSSVTLPPGQRRIERFPRFGTHLGRPAPAVPTDPAISIDGSAVRSSFTLPVAGLTGLPRTELTADFHCVAGWSATDLRWEGVRFETFFTTIIAPQLVDDAAVTHLVFAGLDGYRSVVLVEDACRDDVLLADRLDGRPLDSDHGAPVRLVSPGQYGYISTKHLCRIEVRSSAPPSPRGSLTDRLLESHPRARVWEEERNGSLPGWLVRPVYRALKAPLLWLCSRGTGAAG